MRYRAQGHSKLLVSRFRQDNRVILVLNERYGRGASIQAEKIMVRRGNFIFFDIQSLSISEFRTHGAHFSRFFHFNFSAKIAGGAK